MMKERNGRIGALVFALALPGLCALILSSCLSPLDGGAFIKGKNTGTANSGGETGVAAGGDAYLEIRLPGGTGNARAVVTATEKDGMRYVITLSGPNGESISRILNGGENTLSERVAPGTWTITVKAYVDVPDPSVSSVYRLGQLRGMGTASAIAQSGQSASVAITLKTVTGVAAFDELAAAITNADDGDVVLVTEAIELTGTIPIPANKTVTLLAEGEKVISRAAGFTGYFFDLSSVNSVLNLGDPSGDGELYLRGSKPALTDPLILVYDAGAELVMHDHVFLVDNATSGSAGAVFISCGSFEMNGGTIGGNTATGSGSGVSVGGTTPSTPGTFTMNGGTISGNDASAYTGGGVRVSLDGFFTMAGGSITGNTAGTGGGVYVDSGGNFTSTGGSVTSNTASIGGGGVAVGGSGTFSMQDGSVTGNTASIGGGVAVEGGGDFSMQDGVITGNTATSGANLYDDGATISNTILWNSGTIDNAVPGGAGIGRSGATFLGWNTDVSSWDETETYWNGSSARPDDGVYPMWSGDGSAPTAPIAVAQTAAGAAVALAGIASDLTKHYFLTQDITVSGTWTVIGDDVTSFTGSLNGNRHTITFALGVTIIPSVSSNIYMGLFGYMDGATVRNLTVAGTLDYTNTDTTHHFLVGGIAGDAWNGVSIVNSAVTCDIRITQSVTSSRDFYVGGIAGRIVVGSTISACSSTGNLEVVDFDNNPAIGGIAGMVDSGCSISACYNTGDITHNPSGTSPYLQVGGIAGYLNNTIEYCYNRGIISGPFTSDGVGGIVGNGSGSVSRCVALNPNINSSIPPYGRICGDYITPSNSYGLSTMQLNSAPAAWTNPKDGAGVTTADAAALAWWTGTAGWSIAPTAASRVSEAWVWDSANHRPKLYWEP
ncbi:MAG: hypothetical protein LBT16_08620 [Treponema sp.]|jgi:hypothetical protein|nr:hypothetical protein [Treponema sp.]